MLTTRRDNLPEFTRGRPIYASALNRLVARLDALTRKVEMWSNIYHPIGHARGGKGKAAWRARIIGFSGDALDWIGRRINDDGSDLDTEDQIFYARRADPEHAGIKAEWLVPPYRAGGICYVEEGPRIVNGELVTRLWLRDSFTATCEGKGEPPPPPPGEGEPPEGGIGAPPPAEPPGLPEFPPFGEPILIPEWELYELRRAQTGGRGCCDD